MTKEKQAILEVLEYYANNEANLTSEFAREHIADTIIAAIELTTKEEDQMKYNHAYDIAFSLESNHPKGEDVTPDMLRTALLNRIKDLDRANEWGEIHANSIPFDTYEVEED